MTGSDGLDLRRPMKKLARAVSVGPQVHIARVTSPDSIQLFLACRPEPGPGRSLSAQLRSLYRGIFGCLKAEGARPVEVVAEKLFFRDIAEGRDAMASLRTSGEFPWGEYGPASIAIEEPPSIDGENCWAQLHVFIPAAGRDARWWSFGSEGGAGNGHQPPFEKATGKALSIDGKAHYWIGNLLGRPEGGFYSEALGMFEAGAALLATQGVKFGSVARTWIYLREMERDYGELNRARRAFFERQGVGRRPASTGIGGAPVLPANQTSMSLYAIVGPADLATMHTPTLNEAHEYGSDFSRGMSVEEGGRRTLYISGTASVDEEGRTVHLDDFDAQVERMLLNIEMLLENDRATFRDMVSAITYLKDLRDAPKFLAALERRGITDFPHSIVKAEVCRPELLCEMEGIAVVPARNGD